MRVSDKGHKTFVVYRRVAGKNRPVRFALGSYPLLALDAARDKARDALEDLSTGKDPRVRVEELSRAQQKREADTFAGVAEAFIKRHVKNLRWARAVEATIRREMISRWGARPIRDITRRDVVEMLEEIVDGNSKGKRKKGGRKPGGRYAARHAFAYASKLFNWAIARNLYGLEFSPCERIKVRDVVGRAEPRQRVLTNQEIFDVWSAADAEGYPFGTVTKLLLLTGQRLNDVACMSWAEIDERERLWSIPPERIKHDSAHEVPLSTTAFELLQTVPRFSGPYVFTTTAGRRPVSGFSGAKERLDKRIADVRSKRQAKGTTAPMAKWIFHDLRRTMRTQLSMLPVQDLVRELTIGHAKPGLHKVYDRYAYREEKREALQLWCEKLGAITSAAD